MGSEHNYEIPGFAFNRIGSLVPDIGCDRKCDFCQTPTYGNGYKQMTPERLLQWAEVQKEAGAQAISMTSDQFLARVLWKGGREQILEACRGLRDMDLAFFWPNGLELRKATIGRGFNREGTDLRPDEELINALRGWDGGTGCGHAFIPAA